MSDNFLDLAQLDAIPDQTLLEDGSEHELQILKAEIGESKGEKTEGQKYLRVMLKSVEEPDSKPFSDIFMLPFAGLEKEKFNQRGRRLRDFLKSAEFDYSSGWNILEDTEELHGLTCRATVKIRETEDYGDQNEIKTYL